MKKVAVLLAGCGVYDGSEIHEAVFTLLSIARQGGSYQCFAPDKEQLHVINHVTGSEMPEKRNVLVESARIARGEIKPVSELKPSEYDGLVIPGGFGAAKNLNQWAIKGPEGEIDPDVARVIREFVKARIPVAGLCMGPTVIASALKGVLTGARLTVGSTAEKSPYDIQAISNGLVSTGAVAEYKTIREFTVDDELKIVTAPCYMMEGSIDQVYGNVQQAIEALFDLM